MDGSCLAEISCAASGTAAVEIVFINISVGIQLGRIYIPVRGIAAVRNTYCIAGVKLADLVGGIEGFRAAEGQISFVHAYGPVGIGITGGRGYYSVQVIVIDIAVSVIFRRVNIPLSGTSGVICN